MKSQEIIFVTDTPFSSFPSCRKGAVGTQNPQNTQIWCTTRAKSIQNWTMAFMPWEEDDEDKSYLDNLLKQLAEGDTEDEEFLEMLEAHVLGLDGRFSDNKLDQEPLPYILSSLFFCLFYAFYRNRNVYTLRQLQYE